MNNEPDSSKVEKPVEILSRHSSSEPSTIQLADNLRKQSNWLRWIIVALVLITLVLAGHLWYAHGELSSLREEIARRLQTGDSASAEAKAIAKTTQDGLLELHGKVGALESKQSDSQNQQLSLAQMYQDLSKSRDDWVLAESERVLSTANQELQLSGNLQGALAALENADRSLSGDKPQFIVIRRALARDIERLRAVPHVDVTGMTLKIDQVIAQIDSLPLLSSEKPLASSEKSASESTEAKKETKSAEQAQATDTTTAPEKEAKPNGWWTSTSRIAREWLRDMWGEVRTLVQIQNVDAPDALMLSPTQAYYLRQNLQLRLLGARFALLARNETTFRNDIQVALKMLDRYFDAKAGPTKAAKATLQQVAANNLSIEMPDLSDSLNAIHNYRVRP